MGAQVIQSKGFSLLIFFAFDLKVIQMISSHPLDQPNKFIVEAVEHFLLLLIVISHSSGINCLVFILQGGYAFEEIKEFVIALVTHIFGIIWDFSTLFALIVRLRLNPLDRKTLTSSLSSTLLTIVHVFPFDSNVVISFFLKMGLV